MALSISKVFRSIHFLRHFHCFYKWAMFVIFQVNAYFLINQLTKHFYTRHFSPHLNLKKKSALHRIIFQKHPRLTTFLLVFTVDVVCNITNKNQPSRNLAKYRYFYRRDLVAFFHCEKKMSLSIVNFFWNTHFLPHLHCF